MHTFSGPVEHAIAHIEEAAVHDMPAEQQRWYAIKIFERDDKVLEQLKLSESAMAHIEQDIKAAEDELDDDAESIITNERYIYIAQLMKGSYKKKSAGKLSTSDKIDKVVTNRFAALPIFAAIMFIVYFVSVTTVGTWATDWANDGVFGDGWHFLGIGSSAYEEESGEFGDASNVVNAFINSEKEGSEELAQVLDVESESFDSAVALASLKSYASQFSPSDTAEYTLEDEETLAVENVTFTGEELSSAVEVYEKYNCEEPAPENYGVWVPGIPVMIEDGLSLKKPAPWSF